MTSITSITEKVQSGERITDDDALFLFRAPELLEIGELAAHANREKNGDRVFFNVNRHINHTNICVNRCAFCAFSKTANEPGAYAYDLQEIENRAVEALQQGATEIHMVGGLHPDLPFEFYLAMLRRVREVSPSLHVKAFTAVEIDYLARLAGLSIPETLAELKEAGLGSLPGGGGGDLQREGPQCALSREDFGRALAGDHGDGSPGRAQVQCHYALRPSGGLRRPR